LTTEQILSAILHEDQALRRQLQSLGLSWEKVQATTSGIPQRIEESLPIEESLRLGDVTERIDTARILDAGFNRAREALRVIEDYCRFVLDDRFLSGELKRLRHDFVDALERHDPDRSWDLVARETLSDVGTSLTAPQEHERNSLHSVLQ